MSRRGLAMLLAVVVLGLVSAIAATAVELAIAEHKNGAGLRAATQARAAAEAALAEASQGWAPGLRPAGAGSSQSVWARTYPQGVQAELVLLGTDGPFVIAAGRGSKLGAGMQMLATAEVRGVVRPDSFPPDTLERPRLPPRWRWRSPP